MVCKLPIYFIYDIYRSRELLLTMTKREISNRYLGSLLGGVWAFIQPLITILVMWFVFQVGFKAQATSEGVPFALWLVSGMIPWFFFAEALSNSTYSIIEQASIVKKIVFRVSLLPLVKLLAALVIHLFFIFILLVIAVACGYYPSFSWMQIPYYLICSLALLLGMSWITSSVVVFFRDLGQFIAVLIQLGFWGTPIFWNVAMVPEKYHWIFKINPVFYITEGYRNSVIGDAWFWQEPQWGIYFWLVTFGMLLAGSICFKKLKPHFADVL